MVLKDYITIITAIVDAILGIVNIIIDIQEKLKENIRLYCNDLEMRYKFKGTEELYTDMFIKVPLEINYSFHILNNKSKAIPI